MGPLWLQHGLLSMQFDPEVGMLRYLKVGDLELLRGIYAAVRLDDWGTYPHRVGRLRLATTADGFRLTWEDASGPVDWKGEIVVSEREVVYAAHGVAREAFTTQRTGVVVLHAASAGGDACRIEHTDGSVDTTAFPETIAPDQPFFDVRAIEHEVAPGFWVRTEMTGEVFETEDQRNWIDASFKTYCRPLDWPRPYPINGFDEISHRVTVRIPEGDVPASVDWTRAPRSTAARPEIGAILEGDEPDGLLVHATLPDYLAMILDTEAPDAEARFVHAADVAARFHRPLEVHVRGGDAATLARLDAAHPAARYFVVDGALRRALRETPLRGRVWSATTDNFTELNRERPDRDEFDGVGFAVHAQVHAFDDQSILETPEGLGYAIATAKEVYPGLPVRVSPAHFSLKPDPRADGPLAVAWAIRMIQEAKRAEADGLTLLTVRQWQSPLLASLVGKM